MGTVSVDFEVNSKRRTVWSLSGDKGDAWQSGTIPVPPIEGGFKVQFCKLLLVSNYDLE